jgi:hypothetical protein
MEYRLWSIRITSSRHPKRPWVLFCSDEHDDHVVSERIARFSTLASLMSYCRQEFPDEIVQTLPAGVAKL